MEKLIKLILTMFKKPVPPASSGAPAEVTSLPISPVVPEPVTVPILDKPVPVPEPIKQPEPEPDYGLEVVKAFEGCKLKAYQDIIGVWTIGYGQTGPHVKDGLVWTQEQADKALEEEYSRFSKVVTKNCAPRLVLNTRQHQALTSFTYNCGERNLQNLIRNRSVDQVGDAITLYDKAGGKPVKGLTIRRTVEQRLYNSVIDSRFDVHGERKSVTAFITGA